MRIPLSWLKDYVDITLPVEELAHRLTMAGLEVGAVERIGGEWDRDKVLVGRVTSVDPHPNADRLRLATVDLGGETWTVVCGAPNVAPGQKIAFAREGARLYNAHSGRVETLKKAKIRGVESAGMVCSELELGLGLGEDHTGILVLPDDAPVGTPLADYMGDVVLELEVTPNRPDWLSVLGVAREVAAIAGQRVREPDLSYPEEGEPIESLARVEVQDAELCPRYTASLITEVKIRPSPQWMQERLERAGQRPINNVVDITNYVMLEYGQPLHAFDFDLVKQGTIVVRQARQEEALVTIDDEEHALEPPMLVIADPERAVGLAGVMGGANTEMTGRTTSVFLESANFHPTNNRRTARSLGMRTEASIRFEKGLGPGLPPVALRRATQLIVRLAGGKAAKGILDDHPGRREQPRIPLTAQRVRRVLGDDIPEGQVSDVLASLGFDCQRREPGVFDVGIPYWRTDVALPEDLVEEVARIVGYDRVPVIPIAGAVPRWRPQPDRELRERVRDLLAACGMQEVITYTLVSRENLERVEAVDGVTPLRVANPMSREQEYLRTSLRGSLLTTLAANLRRSPEEGLRLFEVGRAYLPRRGDLPREREIALGVLAGLRQRLSWTTGEGEAMDFYDAKGTVEAVMERLEVSAAYQPATDPILHPGRCAAITVGKAQMGVIGEVHPRVLERFDMPADRVALLELDLEALLKVLPEEPRHYELLPRFPGTLRDLALVVERDVRAAEVQRLIQSHPLVAHAIAFDVYEGERIGAGKRSLAYRVLFRSPDRTLNSEEVNEARDQILRLLRRDLGATLRG